ncbi:MAG TPA: PEPxxWA-CTERM sorting domain-containing protein [Sphingomicrobium sp.]
MLRTRLFTIAAAVAAITAVAPASAAVVLDGNYIKVGINNQGTLGSGGSTSPGLIHDPSGTASFDPSTDYITPGIPHEGYSINSTQSGFVEADNTGASGFGTASPTILTGADAMGFDNAASWSGSNSFVDITNSYFFNDGSERIEVYTTLTALSDLTNLAFARSVDPDSGGFDSINQRGNSLFDVDDFIGSASAANGRTLALVNLNGDVLTHNTQINSSCCSNIDPYTVLLGSADNATGDFGLNIAWLIGDLGMGNSVTIHYAYAVGTKIDVVGGPGGNPGAVPEPATWAMMLLGFGFVGGAMRRGRRQLKLAAA